MAQAAEALSATERGYRIASLNGEPAGLPLLIQPGESSDVGRLCAFELRAKSGKLSTPSHPDHVGHRARVRRTHAQIG